MTAISVTITGVELHDEFEGVVKVSPRRGCEIAAFFYGDVFEVGEQFDPTFDHLYYPLDWEVIFSENKERSIELVPAPGVCSYYGYGVIKSINPIIADFGCISLNIGEWSNDERIIGEFIYWKIDSLDISRSKV